MNPPTTPKSVLHIVIGTYSAVTIIAVLTLAILSIMKIQPSESVLGMLKDIALVAIGGLGAFLASIKSGGAPDGTQTSLHTESRAVTDTNTASTTPAVNQNPLTP